MLMKLTQDQADPDRATIHSASEGDAAEPRLHHFPATDLAFVFMPHTGCRPTLTRRLTKDAKAARGSHSVQVGCGPRRPVPRLRPSAAKPPAAAANSQPAAGRGTAAGDVSSTVTELSRKLADTPGARTPQVVAAPAEAIAASPSTCWS